MIRKLLGVLGATGAAVALVAAPAAASPAPASYGGNTAVTPAHFDHCPAGRFCIFAGTNGGHPYAYFALGDGDLGDGSGPRGMNNTTESVWNRTNRDWCLYDGTSFNPNTLFGITFANGRPHDLPVSVRNILTSLRPC